MSQELQNNDAGQPEPTSTDGGDAGEAQAWEALQSEVGGDGGEPSPKPTETPAEPEPPIAADKAKSKDSRADGEPESKGPTPEQLASQYQAAMREERVKRQAMERQLAEIQGAITEARQARDQPAPTEAPSIDDDPIAYFEHQQRQLAAQLEETQQRQAADTEAREQANAQTQFMTSVQTAEQQFATQTPDYFEAADHLRGVRMTQLSSIYPDGPAGDYYANQNGYLTASDMRNAHLEQEVAMYADTAFKTGQNPAEMFYNLAKSAGYAVKAPTPAPQEKIAMARAGIEAAQTLSGGGGSGGDSGNASISELNDLYLTDPAAADALFDKLAASGALG